MTPMDTGSTVLRLPDALRGDVEAAIATAVSEEWARRLWERDTTLWTTDPVTAQTQNPTLGRWRNHRLATTAVASGRMPITTAAWTDSTWRRPSAMNSGKPTTTPQAVNPSVAHWRPRGRAPRVSIRYKSDNTPATAARPKVTNTGESCGASAEPVASLVAGSVTANNTTPSRPSHRPRVSSFIQ